MSKDEKRTQRGPGGFEDKIDAAMADLEVDLRMGISIPGMTQMRPMIRRTPQKRITRKNIRRKRNTIRSIQMNLRRSLKRTMTRRSLKSLMRKMIPMMMNQMSHRSVSFR